MHSLMNRRADRDDRPDLGYSWLWTYGHLFPAAVLGGAAGLALALGTRWFVWAPLGALGLWMLAGFFVMRFGVRMNEIPPFRVDEFVPRGTASVLDVGCGSGRLGIAIARARAEVSVVGLDNFSADYIEAHGSANTERNYRVTGLADRTTVRTGDMREMPFADGTFDAAASSAAIDHLAPDDIRKTLGEVRRVLAPGGQFLLVVNIPDTWLTIAWGPLIAGKLHDRGFWREALAEAGLTVELECSVRTAAAFLTRRS